MGLRKQVRGSNLQDAISHMYRLSSGVIFLSLKSMQRRIRTLRSPNPNLQLLILRRPLN